MQHSSGHKSGVSGLARSSATQRHLTLRALECVQRVSEGKEPCKPEEYSTLVMGLAPMLLQNGLDQTCGFLLAKGNDRHWCVLQHMVTLVTGRAQMATRDEAQRWFREEVLRADQKTYRWMTRRALQAASALKRYVQALLKDKDKHNK